MKKKSSIIKIIVTVSLAGFALYKAGILTPEGRKDIMELLRHSDYHFVVVSFLLTFVLNFSSVIKWKMILSSRDVNVSIWRLYAFYNIGKFFNLILPTSMGGDVVRIFQLGKHIEDKHTSAASVIVERFTGLITLLLFAILAVIINIKIFNQYWLSVSLGTGALAIFLVAYLVLNQKAFKYIATLPISENKFLRKFLTQIDKIRKPVMEFSTDRRAIFWSLLNSVIFQLLAVVNVWVSSMAFSSEIDFTTCLVAVPVILFIMNIPFSIGGIGLMEFGFVFTFSLFLVSPALSLSTALLIRAKGILDCLIGGVLFLSLNKNRTLLTEIRKNSQELR